MNKTILKPSNIILFLIFSIIALICYVIDAYIINMSGFSFAALLILLLKDTKFFKKLRG